MKKSQKLLERISSKLTLRQAIIGFTIFAIMFMVSFVNELKDYKIDILYTVLWILFFVPTFIFAVISIEKTADNVIERETKKMLYAIKQLLDDEYKLIKYTSDNVSQILELYEDATKMNNQKLYAKLDEDDNICYAIIDDDGNIISKKKNKKYRFFLENFYVYGCLNKSFDE